MNSGQISVGQFVIFLLISTRMTMPLWILGMLLNQLLVWVKQDPEGYSQLSIWSLHLRQRGFHPLTGSD